MAKLTLNDPANLQDEATAIATIAANNAAIEAALENTLSRDGTSPNTMTASLDMNSQRILNLPTPVSNSEPITKGYGDSIYGDASTYAAAAAASATTASTAASTATSAASTASSAATTATTAAATAVAAAAALAFKYTWSTNTASSDPGSGQIKVNAAPGSATALYISETDANGNAIASEIARWDDSVNAAGRARLKIAKDATNFLLLSVTSAVTDNGTWDTYTVSGASLVGTLSNGDTVYITPVISGADGSGTGDVSSNTATSVDGEAVVFNGTTGKSVRRFSLTGLVKAAAGVLAAAVAGTDYVAPGGALGTPSSGTLTNCTSLPISGLTASTSAALGVGSVELGHASDTTLSRISAGVMGVEGVALYPNLPVQSKSAAYTTVLTDAQTIIYHPTADNNARTFTIDSNANVPYPVGTCLYFINDINTVTIALTSDTLVQAGTAATGSRTLAAGGWAMAVKVATTRWYISGPGLA